MAKHKQTSRPSEKLFADNQIDMFEKSYEERLQAEKNRPVECLGMTFDNDEKRREYFLEKLREKLKYPEFRKIEGFPIGEDEDILALSDPPYYTACQNPFIEDFIKHYGKPYDPATDNYRREPFAADVSEGKNDPIYNAHTYHTKVPHKAIMRYILHYTDPGDVVFDGFCGTGMTGVAAQLCGNKATVESLGYKVEKDDTIYEQETNENGKTVWRSFSQLGIRYAILNDLSPLSTFIGSNLNASSDRNNFIQITNELLSQLEVLCGHLYQTSTNNKKRGRINYSVWSRFFVCPECGMEMSFWDVGIKLGSGITKYEFKCPKCKAVSSKTECEYVYETILDPFLGKPHKIVKTRPVHINFTADKSRERKEPDDNDLSILFEINQKLQTVSFLLKRMPEGDESRRNDPFGITHVHHFYTQRNLYVLIEFWRLIDQAKIPLIYNNLMKFLFTSIIDRNAVIRNRFIVNKHNPNGRINGPMQNTLYCPDLFCEVNIIDLLKAKRDDIAAAIYGNAESGYSFSISSSTNLRLPDVCLDYIFVDPPFGQNIMYSELNFITESWLRVLTNHSDEGVVNKTQKKGLTEYQAIMEQCFSEFYRLLKPGRWITTEFHNSKNSVWVAIQEALTKTGFVIATVSTLDKKQGTVHQDTSGGTVKQDLIISAYKPNDGLEERFNLTAGTEEGVWDFVRTHLKQLPTFISKNGQAEVIAERQNYLLFDRMVAFHVQHGVTVPLSAAEFYAGLEQRFPPRNGMYFLPDQAAEYDKKRMTVREVLQLQLFVSDEASAIQWLKQQLTKKPQTFQDIHPQFLKKIGGWQKHEKALELSELLEQNFLRYDGKGEVSSQIHSYLSTNFKELRNLTKDDPVLKAKSKDRWYVPDPNKAGDLEKLRERTLMREFEEYRESKQKRLKVFRLEAVRTGFKKAWQERDYATIIAVARKIPEKVLQEDSKLLMWYDQALTRSGEDA